MISDDPFQRLETELRDIRQSALTLELTEPIDGHVQATAQEMGILSERLIRVAQDQRQAASGAARKP